MEPETDSSNDSEIDFSWLKSDQFRRFEQAREDLTSIWKCGATPDLLMVLQRQLLAVLDDLCDPDAVLSNLSRFVLASRSPIGLLSLFERDESSLPSLLKVFETGQALANGLINDPECFDLMRASDGQPAQRKYLVDELVAEVLSFDSSAQAAAAIRKFSLREIIRIAYGEFVRGLNPDQVGRQLAYVADAALESALQFVSRELSETMGQPQRIDGASPKVSIIGLRNLGGEEATYAEPLQVLFLYDAIDNKNPAHRQYYETLAHRIIALIASDDEKTFGFRVDLSLGPFRKSSLICGIDEAIQELEIKNRTWQRMTFIKSRPSAGDSDLGAEFLKRLSPWIYRKFISRSDFNDIRSLRHKLQRRATSENETESSTLIHQDVLNSPGGRRDIELVVQFLQLMHGGDLEVVRAGNTNDAIIALEKTGCLLHEEAELLAGNYARLCRLQHQLSMLFGGDTTILPTDPAMCKQLAWRLGIRDEPQNQGDLDKFLQQLSEAFAVNRTIINHLISETPDNSDEESFKGAIETELVLDPDADPELIQETLSAHGLESPKKAMEDLIALSNESVRFLSPRRCRHFLAMLAPSLLEEISKTPYPDATLQSLVAVADSLGAKATLWELMRANRPTLQLVVRLCAAAPYLTGILTNNPGMIDELIDSLLMNRLPSTDRLDAQSIELCRGAADIDLILHGFKNSCHLTVGVRDILNLEPIEATHRALSDTAEACLRRIIAHERESLVEQFGDPMLETGEPAELIPIALGKLGGREPNYHSDLDLIFLYSGEGTTKRRVGGRRTTTTNRHFFNALANQVVTKINRVTENGQLYELDGRLRPTGDEGTLAVSIGDFVKQFKQDLAPLWKRLALCKARCIAADRDCRKSVTKELRSALTMTRWHTQMAGEIQTMRRRMEETASPENLKRGVGGTVDVEVIAQMLTLKHAADEPSIIRTGTFESLETLASAGFLSDEQAITLSNNYQTLRGIEARLRLLNTSNRHELPESVESMRRLAFLLGETDPEMVRAQAKQARHSNRVIFDSIFDSSTT